MKIRQAKINHFGKLNDQEMNFDDHINLIYGKNEAGKSTLIKFITSSFYGISKNKRGKELSDFDQYLPWIGEDFSGKISYELDNGSKYEVYRDFRKKNPQLFNEELEEVTKQYSIDKNKGSEFFYEQTKVDEGLFLSTLMVNQQEVKLEKAEQNIFIQKMANLVGTGDDKVSYQRAIDRINRRQLDEIGTDRSREKPINIINRQWQEWEQEKENLLTYRLKQQELEQKREQSEEQIEQIEMKLTFLEQLKKLAQNQTIEEEKIKIKTQMKQELENKLEEITKQEENLKAVSPENNQMETKAIEEEKKKVDQEKKKWKQTISIVIIIAVILNAISLSILSGIVPIFLLVFTFIILGTLFTIITKQKQHKWEKNQAKWQAKQMEKEKQNQEYTQKLSQIQQEKNILAQNQEELEIEITKMNEQYQKEKEKGEQTISASFAQKLTESQRKDILLETKSQGINNLFQQYQKRQNQLKLDFHTLAIEQKSIAPRLSDLANIQEQMAGLKEQKEQLEQLNKSMNLAKEILGKCYEKMKSTVTPRFTQNLSQTVAKITNGKYTHVRFHDEQGLLVETETGNYLPASRLSAGTIDQLYLSLRLSIAKELSEEPMPILLDEAFAYFDEERLTNCLRFLAQSYPNTQIFIFTCTNREQEIFTREQIPFHWLSLEEKS